jgi:hypothetical protein
MSKRARVKRVAPEGGLVAVLGDSKIEVYEVTVRKLGELSKQRVSGNLVYVDKQSGQAFSSADDAAKYVAAVEYNCRTQGGEL